MIGVRIFSGRANVIDSARLAAMNVSGSIGCG
jgi:hypothetical protein